MSGKVNEWGKWGGGLSAELQVQGTEPWAKGWGELESGQKDMMGGKAESSP